MDPPSRLTDEEIETFGPLDARSWWSPRDVCVKSTFTVFQDQLLLRGVQAGLSPREVLRNIRFSVAFSESEVAARWASILYDERVAKRVAVCVRRLESIGLKRIAWSKSEDSIIRKEHRLRAGSELVKGSQPVLCIPHLLNSHRDSFHLSRTIPSVKRRYDRFRLEKPPTETPTIFDFENDELRTLRNTSSSTYPLRADIEEQNKRRQSAALEAAMIERSLKANESAITRCHPRGAFAGLEGPSSRQFLLPGRNPIGRITSAGAPAFDISFELDAPTSLSGTIAEINVQPTPSFSNLSYELVSLLPSCVRLDGVLVAKGESRCLGRGSIVSIAGVLFLKFFVIARGEEEVLNRLRLDNAKRAHRQRHAVPIQALEPLAGSRIRPRAFHPRQLRKPPPRPPRPPLFPPITQSIGNTQPEDASKEM